MALIRRAAGRRTVRPPVGTAALVAATLFGVVLLGVAGCSTAAAPQQGPGAAGLSSAPGTTGSAEPPADPAATGAAPLTPADRGAAGALQDPDLGGTETRATSAGVPVRVSIPALGVDSALESLHRDGEGALQPPVDFASAGWYSEGVVPGSVGPAVIAGHIDSAVGPAVFYRLKSLAPGDVVEVTLSGGETLTFTVDRSIQVAKADFPTDEVYGATPTKQLRLITCGGVFDDAWGHYLDNVVVFASETGATG